MMNPAYETTTNCSALRVSSGMKQLSGLDNPAYSGVMGMNLKQFDSGLAENLVYTDMTGNNTMNESEHIYESLDDTQLVKVSNHTSPKSHPQAKPRINENLPGHNPTNQSFPDEEYVDFEPAEVDSNIGSPTLSNSMPSTTDQSKDTHPNSLIAQTKEARSSLDQTKDTHSDSLASQIKGTHSTPAKYRLILRKCIYISPLTCQN